jgi:HSP20 family protein
MVEKTHTAGWLPQAYEPVRKLREKLADWFAPASDASTVEDAYEITLELPGVNASDIEVSVAGNTLIVGGEKHAEREETGRSYFFSEREFGSFQRTFRMPPDADMSKVDAASSDGVLTISIAKLKSTPEAGRKVEVRRV